MYPEDYQPLADFGQIPANSDRPFGEIFSERLRQEKEETERQDLAQGLIRPRKPPATDQLRYIYHLIEPYQRDVTLQEVEAICTVINAEAIAKFNSSAGNLKRIVLTEWCDWKDPTNPLSRPDRSLMKKLERQQQAERSSSGPTIQAVGSEPNSKRKFASVASCSENITEPSLRPLSQDRPAPLAVESSKKPRGKRTKQDNGLPRIETGSEPLAGVEVDNTAVHEAGSAKKGGHSHASKNKGGKASTPATVNGKGESVKLFQTKVGAKRGPGRPRKVPLLDD